MDQASGALSVGVPVYSTIVRIVDEENRDLPPGQIGELVTEGPQAAAGYWPREVEDVLYEHGAVREAAVVGVPDPYRGETVKAYVSLKPGGTVTVEELAAHCKQRLAAYKYPRLSSRDGR